MCNYYGQRVSWIKKAAAATLKSFINKVTDLRNLWLFLCWFAYFIKGGITVLSQAYHYNVAWSTIKNKIFTFVTTLFLHRSSNNFHTSRKNLTSCYKKLTLNKLLSLSEKSWSVSPLLEAHSHNIRNCSWMHIKILSHSESC